MSEIFNTVFDVIDTVREKAKECANLIDKEKMMKNILEDFERRAEDAPTLLSQGLPQALTFYLYKVESLTVLKNVYDLLFNDVNQKPSTDVCNALVNSQGYLLYTSVLFYLLEKLEIPEVKCKVEDFSKDSQSLAVCLSNISENEAKVYRRLINYVIELKKISKIMIGEATAQASPQS